MPFSVESNDEPCKKCTNLKPGDAVTSMLNANETPMRFAL
jgi:hypothetical protein